ncbi:hypothetical protein T492DRAFT_1025719 [Pavlovales sp. CCMP2436]|nr:hypothetical protein T492DRAFT_1025719 [Pavlovales sp. CCMP2436]
MCPVRSLVESPGEGGSPGERVCPVRTPVRTPGESPGEGGSPGVCVRLAARCERHAWSGDCQSDRGALGKRTPGKTLGGALEQRTLGERTLAQRKLGEWTRGQRILGWRTLGRRTQGMTLGEQTLGEWTRGQRTLVRLLCGRLGYWSTYK